MDLNEFKTRVLPLKNRLFRLAFRILGREEEARDIVQESMIRMWNNREKLDEYQSVEAFAVVITRNLSLDRTRARGFQKNTVPDFIEDEQTQNPYQRMETSDLVKKVYLVMEHLPEQQKTIMHLRDVEEMEYDEIAEVMKMNVNAIRVNLSRARKFVRETLLKMQNYEVTRS
jgi:RNA polymerase sigma-70 factor (ECF subfamily)